MAVALRVRLRSTWMVVSAPGTPLNRVSGASDWVVTLDRPRPEAPPDGATSPVWETASVTPSVWAGPPTDSTVMPSPGESSWAFATWAVPSLISAPGAAGQMLVRLVVSAFAVLGSSCAWATGASWAGRDSSSDGSAVIGAGLRASVVDGATWGGALPA